MKTGPNAIGRIYIPDERDAAYPASAVLKPLTTEAEERGYRYWWADGWWGDQLYKPHCVAYAWAHWLEDGPETVAPYTPARQSRHRFGAAVDPDELYFMAQRVDEWEGEDYSGTSVRAGAKIMQGWGEITSYHWARSVEEIAHAILTTTPVIVGTAWYAHMTNPKEGTVMPAGDYEGGHAYLLNGVNTEQETFRIKNSWGRSWGVDGYALISFEHMALLLDDYGEACVPVDGDLDD